MQVLMTRIDLGDFLLRFTQAERVALKKQTKAIPELQDFYDLLFAFPVIDLTSAMVQDGMALVVSAGVMTQGRAEEIVSQELATPDQIREMVRTRQLRGNRVVSTPPPEISR